MKRIIQIVLPIVILIIGVLLFIFFTNQKKPPEEKPVVNNVPIVSVENITVSSMTLDIDSYGIVSPKYETVLAAQVSGEIVTLSPQFTRGSFVKKGTVLATIDPSDFQAALIDAQANLASAKAQLEQEKAQGKVAKNEWQTITKGSPTDLSLRKPQLAQELARVKSAEAAILRAERNLERTEIKAPYDAIVESRMIGLGSFVGAGTVLGKVLGTDVAQVRLPVSDEQLQYLDGNGVGSSVKLEVSTSDNNEKWFATVTRTEGVIDETSRMEYLVAEVKNPYLLNMSVNMSLNTDKNLTSPVSHPLSPLRFGSYVQAVIKGKQIENATAVPLHLVKNGQIALLSQSSTLSYADINIARQDGENIIVAGGLQTGDRIIVSALDFPIEGSQLLLAEDLPDKSEE